MSIPFSSTSGKNGLIQFIEDTLGFPDAYISGDATRLKQWTAKLNLAFDRTMHTLMSADGKFQWDDRNHSDRPIIYFDLDSTKQSYSITTDANSNLILDFHKVMARQSTTSPYYTLTPIDAQTEDDDSSLTNGLSTTGWPTSYDKSDTSLTLDTFPPSNVTRGMKAFVNREGSYFLTSDTTKTPGFAGLYHEVLILEACYRYARANNLQIREVLKRDIKEIKDELLEYQSKRSRDEALIIRGAFQEYE